MSLYRAQAIQRLRPRTRLLKHSYRPFSGENHGKGFVERFVYGIWVGSGLVSRWCDQHRYQSFTWSKHIFIDRVSGYLG